MKTCLIFGHNGLDLDVTINIRSLYKNIGFNVFFSDKLFNADVLVILRPIDKEINFTQFNFSLIHVYDYVGNNFDNLIVCLPKNKTFIFCTTSETKKRLIDFFNFPSSKIFVAFVPVDVKIWAKKIKPLKYDLVHIGNFKKNILNDDLTNKFYDLVKSFKVHIWGAGWMPKTELSHGKTSVFKVSKIYSSSRFALGLMYPFQRNCTYSGRFWHAPLNGCLVFSEPGYFTRLVPGVYELNYFSSELPALINSMKINRFNLQSEAIVFWQKEYNVVKEYILSSLNNIEFGEKRFRKFIYYLSINIYNELQIFYHKVRSQLF